MICPMEARLMTLQHLQVEVYSWEIFVFTPSTECSFFYNGSNVTITATKKYFIYPGSHRHNGRRAATNITKDDGCINTIEGKSSKRRGAAGSGGNEVRQIFFMRQIFFILQLLVLCRYGLYLK